MNLAVIEDDYLARLVKLLYTIHPQAAPLAVGHHQRQMTPQHMICKVFPSRVSRYLLQISERQNIDLCLIDTVTPAPKRLKRAVFMPGNFSRIAFVLGQCEQVEPTHVFLDSSKAGNVCKNGNTVQLVTPFLAKCSSGHGIHCDNKTCKIGDMDMFRQSETHVMNCCSLLQYGIIFINKKL
jgi:hypothetical protein